MGFYGIILVISLVQVLVAAACNALLTPRIRGGRLARGRASIIALAALLISPALAALTVPLVVPAGQTAVYGIGLYFYAGYAVGLACFIVLNRRFRDLDRR